MEIRASMWRCKRCSPLAYYNSSRTLCIKCSRFSISYWDLIKFPYFAETTKRELLFSSLLFFSHPAPKSQQKRGNNKGTKERCLVGNEHVRSLIGHHQLIVMSLSAISVSQGPPQPQPPFFFFPWVALPSSPLQPPFFSFFPWAAPPSNPYTFLIVHYNFL